MFELNENMKFINIDLEYIKALNMICPEVYYKPIGYENKPYIGILINEANRSYVIPLSSAKDKHKKWKNVNQECYLVYEHVSKAKMGTEDIWIQETEEETKEETEEDTVKHIISVIDIKKMIPIKEGVYTIVNINKESSDTLTVEKYKDLLNKEYVFCLKIIDDLIKKANKLYDQQMSTGRVKKFCCNFKALEQVCDTYPI